MSREYISDFRRFPGGGTLLLPLEHFCFWISRPVFASNMLAFLSSSKVIGFTKWKRGMPGKKMSYSSFRETGRIPVAITAFLETSPPGKIRGEAMIMGT